MWGTRRRLRAWTLFGAAVLAIAGWVPASFATSSTTSSRASTVRDLSLEPASFGPIVSGRPVTFKATAPRSLASARVHLLRRVGHGTWARVGAATVSSSGRFRITGPAVGVGTSFWKAKTLVNGVRHVSMTKRTTVYRWYNLTAQNMVSGGDLYSSPVDIGSQSFKNADLVRLEPDGATTGTGYWDLSYECIEFSTSIGLTNESVTGSAADFAFSLDGEQALLGSKDMGDPTRELVYVSSRQRLGLTVTATSNALMYPAFAAPKVLCVSNPFG